MYLFLFLDRPVNKSQQMSTTNTKERRTMPRKRKKELMVISFDKASELYQSTLVTEGKSPRYIDWLKTRLRSFSTWAHEEGYSEENIMRRLKLPQPPKALPGSLTEEEIQRVLAVSLDQTYERFRNFSMLMLFLDTGIRLSGQFP